jgi:DNA-directed RNA polymerase specialized sigma24 family protein
VTADAAHGRVEEPNGVTAAELLRAWPAWEARLRGFAERQLRSRDVPSGRLDAEDVVQQSWLILRTAKESIEYADRYAYIAARRLIRKAACEGDRFAPTPMIWTSG